MIQLKTWYKSRKRSKIWQNLEHKSGNGVSSKLHLQRWMTLLRSLCGRSASDIIYTINKSWLGSCYYQKGQAFFVRVMCLVQRHFLWYSGGAFF